MIVVDNFDQGSTAWHSARAGIPTASQASRILTPKTLKLAAGRQKYINELLEEWRTGGPAQDLNGIAAVERGRELEPQALAWYEVVYDETPQKVGLVYNDDRTCACSPDGFVRGVVHDSPGGEVIDWTHGLEVKNPSGPVHIGYMRQAASDDGDRYAFLPGDYRAQVQFSLWVTQLPMWRFLSHHPEMPPVVVDVEPEDAWQTALDELMPTFLAELEAAKQFLLDRGVRPLEARSIETVERPVEGEYPPIDQWPEGW